MDLVKCVVAGLIGGAIGAVVWAALAYYANFEFAIVAWGIGALVGVCCRAGTGASSGLISGLIASAIALGSIAGGKYAVVHIVVERETAKLKASMDSSLAQSLTDDDLVMAIGEDLIKESNAKGKKQTWPKGRSADDDRETMTDYPATIVKDAKARWKALSPSDRETYKQQKQDQIRGAIDEASASFAAEAKSEVFASSFGLFDIVFGMLALLTAYKIGADEGD